MKLMGVDGSIKEVVEVWRIRNAVTLGEEGED